jgi:hypothetical protein
MNAWLRCLGSALGECFCIYVAGARLLTRRLAIVILVLLRFLLLGLLLLLRGIGPAQLSRLLTVPCQIATFLLLGGLFGIALLLLSRHPIIFGSIFLPIIGVGALMFLYDRWHAWYPDQKLGPIVRRYAVRLLRIGAIGLAYAEVRRYLNELTRVDPGNFPIALTALTTLLTLPMWLAISPLVLELIVLWYVLRYYGARITRRLGRYRPLSNDWLQELDLGQIGHHREPLKYLTDAWYRVRNSQSVRSFWGLELDDRPDLFNKTLWAGGAMCLLVSNFALIFLLAAPWSYPFVRLTATNVLVATEFSYDRTCVMSSETRRVAVLKYRREMQTSMVSIADLHGRMKLAPMWRDISFTIGTCDRTIPPSAPGPANLTDL